VAIRPIKKDIDKMIKFLPHLGKWSSTQSSIAIVQFWCGGPFATSENVKYREVSHIPAQSKKLSTASKALYPREILLFQSAFKKPTALIVVFALVQFGKF